LEFLKLSAKTNPNAKTFGRGIMKCWIFSRLTWLLLPTERQLFDDLPIERFLATITKK
jgi:hypothetical protein